MVTLDVTADATTDEVVLIDGTYLSCCRSWADRGGVLPAFAESLLSESALKQLAELGVEARVNTKILEVNDHGIQLDHEFITTRGHCLGSRQCRFAACSDPRRRDRSARACRGRARPDD
jgi:hypothetical protein